MRIISKKKQRECVARLIAIRRITDDMNYQSSFSTEKENVERWVENMEYLADNIIEIANIVGGIPAMVAIANDIKKKWGVQNERIYRKAD